MPTNINNPVTIEGVELGRFLFYDPILSRDSTISCSSCHNQSASFSDSPRKFSKGINDKIQTRNTPPLFNLAWYESMFWDGRAKDIESQIFIPVTAHDEMDITWEEATVRVNQNSFYSDKFQKAFPNTIIDSTLISKAIGQFERTMLSYNSKYDRVLNRKDYFTPDEYQGFLLANDQSKGNCLHCHTTDSNGLGTTGKFSNNGLSTAKVTKEYLDRGKGGITKIENEIGLFRVY